MSLIKKYNCMNIGGCKNANDKVVFEIPEGEELKCPICGKTMLVEIKKSSINWKIIIGAILIIALGGAAAYYLSKEPTKPVDPAISQTNIESLTFEKNDIEIAIDNQQKLSVITMPDDATDNLIWNVSDNTIASVDNNGLVKGLKAGKATITVTAEKAGVSANTTIIVSDENTEEEQGEEAVNPTVNGRVDNLRIGNYATYTGQVKNGKPHDAQGRMTFTKTHIIDSRDIKERKAENGWYIIGEYKDGKLVQGKLYKSDGNYEFISIGL